MLCFKISNYHKLCPPLCPPLCPISRCTTYRHSVKHGGNPVVTPVSTRSWTSPTLAYRKWGSWERGSLAWYWRGYTLIVKDIRWVKALVSFRSFSFNLAFSEIKNLVCFTLKLIKSFHLITFQNVFHCVKCQIWKSHSTLSYIHLTITLQRPVAIKTLRKDSVQAGTQDFMREAEVMHRLLHSNIVRLLGICREPSLMLVSVLYLARENLMDSCDYTI